MLAGVATAELVATAEAVIALAVVADGTIVAAAAGATKATADGSWETAWVVAADDCVRLLSACCV